MIKNERQYWVTRSEAERFERLLSESEERADDDVHPLIAKARRDASNSRLLDLKADLQEYESLKAGKFDMSGLMIVTALPEMLIKARIARGMTQRDLAQRIGLKEQQIQRYEATDYASASLSRIMDVVAGLVGESVSSFRSETGDSRGAGAGLLDAGDTSAETADASSDRPPGPRRFIDGQ